MPIRRAGPRIRGTVETTRLHGTGEAALRFKSHADGYAVLDGPDCYYFTNGEYRAARSLADSLLTKRRML